MSQLIAYLSQAVPVIDWNRTTIAFKLVDCLLRRAVLKIRRAALQKTFKGTVAGRIIQMNSRLWVDMSGNDLYRIRKSIDNHSVRAVREAQIPCEQFALE